MTKPCKILGCLDYLTNVYSNELKIPYKELQSIVEEIQYYEAIIRRRKNDIATLNIMGSPYIESINRINNTFTIKIKEETHINNSKNVIPDIIANFLYNREVKQKEKLRNQNIVTAIKITEKVKQFMLSEYIKIELNDSIIRVIIDDLQDIETNLEALLKSHKELTKQVTTFNSLIQKWKRESVEQQKILNFYEDYWNKGEPKGEP